MELPVMLTVKELAEKTHFKEWFIRKSVRDGWLPCIRCGDGKNSPMLFDAEVAAEAIREHMCPVGRKTNGEVVRLKDVQRRAGGM